MTSSTSALLLSCAVVLAVAAAALDTSPAPFHIGYSPLFGGDNVVRSPDGRTVRLKLDRYTGKWE